MLDRTSSFKERAEFGKALRNDVPRSSHALWQPPANRRAPLELLEENAEGRLGGLIPLRNSRMAESAFAFFRGSAIVMAADLAATPVTGITVQACGDAHCLNFGGYATPERNLIFDLNDFDETLPGPWEWDLKRFVTSLVLAGRMNGYRNRDTQVAALAGIQSYRMRMADLATEPPLNVWYARLNAVKILDEARSAASRRRRDTIAAEAATASVAAAVAKFTEIVDGRRRFKDDPPILFHSAATDHDGFDVAEIFARYTETLRDDVRALYERYTLRDHAIKVVGVGSVGTRCAIGLFESHDDDAIILQVKQAVRSVLEPYLQPCAYRNQGERVVQGQRLTQAASDVFLGWASSGEHDFYVRQFKDMKASADLEKADQYDMREYAQYCAWALAAAHARSGDAAAIDGYIGKSDVFDRAILEFADAYADCAEADYEQFVQAIDEGEIEAA